MSGVFKAIGKAFKAVVKVVKKVALPALAIGAVVLTGGAALGALPSLGAMGAKLGLSAALQGVLSTAGTSALIGAGVAAATGKDIIKGATGGFITGGVLGGLGAVTGGLGGAAQTAKAGAQAAGSTAAQGAGTVAQAAGATAGTAAQAAGGAITAGAAPFTANMAGLGGLAADAAASTAGAFGSAIPAAASGLASAAAPASVSPLSSVGNVANGALKFIANNPVPVGMALQGLGAGLSAKAQADAAREEREAIAKNYTTSGLFTLPSTTGPALPEASNFYQQAIYGKQVYDPTTGRIIPAGA